MSPSSSKLAMFPTQAVVAVGIVGALLAGYLLVTVTKADAVTGRCRGKQATIVGTARNDDIDGTSGRDVIQGRGGHDEIDGNGGNDLICGGKGNDDLEGDAGNDRLFGNRGNDDLSGDRGNDRLIGGSGFDEGDGDEGNDVCRKIEVRESC